MLIARDYSNVGSGIILFPCYEYQDQQSGLRNVTNHLLCPGKKRYINIHKQRVYYHVAKYYVMEKGRKVFHTIKFDDQVTVHRDKFL